MATKKRRMNAGSTRESETSPLLKERRYTYQEVVAFLEAMSRKLAREEKTECALIRKQGGIEEEAMMLNIRGLATSSRGVIMTLVARIRLDKALINPEE